MSERRTAAKLIRFHPEELARITERARACGRTSARLIRETALGAIPKPRHYAATGALLRTVARVGSSLEQLARAVQAGQSAALSERVSAALDAYRALVRQVVQDRRAGTGDDLPVPTGPRVRSRRSKRRGKNRQPSLPAGYVLQEALTGILGREVGG